VGDRQAQLKESGFKDENDLDETIKQVDSAIQRARNKELGIDDTEEKEPPASNLLDIPDDELSEGDKKEKRKQRLLKASYDARIRAKAAKEEAKAKEVTSNLEMPGDVIDVVPTHSAISLRCVD
jgi:actin-related protein 5